MNGKRFILKIGIGCFLFLIFCTITSIQIERLMMPEIVSIRSTPISKEWDTQYRVPISCLYTDERGTEGIFCVVETEGIWGKKELQVKFAPHFIVGIEDDSIIINEKSEVVEASSRQLYDGIKVKKAAN